jgi:acyl-CoA synthetase (AMP-forming)/AMP-acid ligase II
MQAYYEAIGLTRGPGGSRFYVPMPMYHGTAAHAVMMSLSCGATLCIGKKFSASRFWPEVRASRATAFVYVGETARYLLAAPPSPRDKEHNVSVAWGNGMRPDVFEKFMDRFGIEMVSEFFNSSEGIFGMVNYSCRGMSCSFVSHIAS